MIRYVDQITAEEYMNLLWINGLLRTVKLADCLNKER